jgi:hypothetical protein
MPRRSSKRGYVLAGPTVLLLFAATVATHAQMLPGGTLQSDAHAQRQLRAVEGRSVTQPDAAALDAMNARRSLVRGQPGALSPTQRRVERGLDALSTADPAAGAATSARRPAPPTDNLPSSYDDDAFLPQSRGSSVVQGLLDRAADGIAASRLDQARSDLALAERQLDTLDDAEAVPLRDQAVALRLRLTPR